MLTPGFALTAGGLRSTSAAPAGGPTAFAVDRDVDVPLDLARAWLSDRSGVDLGDRLELQLGHGGELTSVFTGEVAEVAPSVTGTLVVAVGTLRALLGLRVAVRYEDRSLGQIGRDLAGRAGLVPATIEEGPVLPRFVLDLRRSAYEQLQDLAHRLGRDLYADRAGRVVLRALGGGPPVVGATLGAAAGGPAFRYGADVLAASGARRPPLWDAVAVGGESPASTRGRSATEWLTTDDGIAAAEEGTGDRRVLVVDPLARTKDVARDLAAGRLHRGARQAHEVAVTLPGRPDLELGDDAMATGLPEGLLRASGHVRSLRHRLDAAGGFTTRVGLAVGGSP